MTVRRDQSAAFDQMMAEIQLDADDDGEHQVRCARQSAEHKVSISVRAAADRRLSAKETKPSPDSSIMSDADHESTGNSEADRGVSSKASVQRASDPRRNRRSGSGSSEDSDGATEAAVKHFSIDQFKNWASMSRPQVAVESRVESNALRSFLTRAPKHGSNVIRCIVERDRQGLNMLHPVFRLFLEDGKQFLLCAQKRTSSKTSNYLLTAESAPTDRRSAQTLGKLRGNWSGSEYIVYDDGLSASKTALESSVRSILGIVEFAYDEMGPGRMNIRIPKVQESGLAPASSQWKDPELETRGAPARKALDEEIARDTLLLRNKRPQFDAKSGGHVLDFRGRITMPSVKNFQVQSEEHGDDAVLQFGRVSCPPHGPRSQCKCHKNSFVMDVKYPLSPIQAFAICLSTLDSKFADLRLYESMTKLVKRK